MASMDYGALLRIDGKIFNEGFHFMFMKECVGFVLDEIKDSFDRSHNIEGNYFVYFGDKEFLVCVYKLQLLVISEGKMIEYFAANYDTGNEHFIGIGKTSLKISKLYGNKLYAEMSYKGKHYECIFGYGIDSDREVYDEIKNDKDWDYDDSTIDLIDSWWNEDV